MNSTTLTDKQFLQLTNIWDIKKSVKQQFDKTIDDEWASMEFTASLSPNDSDLAISIIKSAAYSVKSKDVQCLLRNVTLIAGKNKNDLISHIFSYFFVGESTHTRYCLEFKDASFFNFFNETFNRISLNYVKKALSEAYVFSIKHLHQNNLMNRETNEKINGIFTRFAKTLIYAEKDTIKKMILRDAGPKLLDFIKEKILSQNTTPESLESLGNIFSTYCSSYKNHTLSFTEEEKKQFNECLGLILENICTVDKKLFSNRHLPDYFWDIHKLKGVSSENIQKYFQMFSNLPPIDIYPLHYSKFINRNIKAFKYSIECNKALNLQIINNIKFFIKKINEDKYSTNNALFTIREIKYLITEFIEHDGNSNSDLKQLLEEASKIKHELKTLKANNALILPLDQWIKNFEKERGDQKALSWLQKLDEKALSSGKFYKFTIPTEEGYYTQEFHDEMYKSKEGCPANKYVKTNTQELRYNYYYLPIDTSTEMQEMGLLVGKIIQWYLRGDDNYVNDAQLIRRTLFTVVYLFVCENVWTPKKVDTITKNLKFLIKLVGGVTAKCAKFNLLQKYFTSISVQNISTEEQKLYAQAFFKNLTYNPYDLHLYLKFFIEELHNRQKCFHSVGEAYGMPKRMQAFSVAWKENLFFWNKYSPSEKVCPVTANELFRKLQKEIRCDYDRVFSIVIEDLHNRYSGDTKALKGVIKSLKSSRLGPHGLLKLLTEILKCDLSDQEFAEIAYHYLAAINEKVECLDIRLLNPLLKKMLETKNLFVKKRNISSFLSNILSQKLYVKESHGLVTRYIDNTSLVTFVSPLFSEIIETFIAKNEQKALFSYIKFELFVTYTKALSLDSDASMEVLSHNERINSLQILYALYRCVNSEDLSETDQKIFDEQWSILKAKIQQYSSIKMD